MHLGGALQQSGAQKAVRQLAEHPGAVARAGVAAHGPTVLEVLERFEGELDDAVAGLTGERYDAGQTACIVLFGGVVETGANRCLLYTSRCV